MQMKALQGHGSCHLRCAEPCCRDPSASAVGRAGKIWRRQLAAGASAAKGGVAPALALVLTAMDAALLMRRLIRATGCMVKASGEVRKSVWVGAGVAAEWWGGAHKRGNGE